MHEANDGQLERQRVGGQRCHFVVCNSFFVAKFTNSAKIKQCLSVNAVKTIQLVNLVRGRRSHGQRSQALMASMAAVKGDAAPIGVPWHVRTKSSTQFHEKQWKACF